MTSLGSLLRQGELFDSKSETLRFNARAEIAGQPFGNIVLDVGFAHNFDNCLEKLPRPILLHSDNIRSNEAPVEPLAGCVTQKFHAYIMDDSHAAGAKALLDLVTVALSFTCRVKELRNSTTFVDKASEPMPFADRPPPEDWRLAYRRMTNEVGLNHDIVEGHRIASKFLNPILRSKLNERILWNPSRLCWNC